MHIHTVPQSYSTPFLLLLGSTVYCICLVDSRLWTLLRSVSLQMDLILCVCVNSHKYRYTCLHSVVCCILENNVNFDILALNQQSGSWKTIEAFLFKVTPGFFYFCLSNVGCSHQESCFNHIFWVKRIHETLWNNAKELTLFCLCHLSSALACRIFQSAFIKNGTTKDFCYRKER